ncbi:hypothetical protein ORI89_15415 [Sphingobacterium sp. UT-1RO-CII-1]|nr:hypothetical protein [Sphingobacterium sp. UT-1RO-CII-1]MCY4781048.1 hypothetical protein [Sphingobacterium sp. UT-1RO-CII-1]
MYNQHYKLYDTQRVISHLQAAAAIAGAACLHLIVIDKERLLPAGLTAG